jgi:ketosteroid isomerase-like protein
MKKVALTFLILLPILLMAQSNKQVTEDFLQSFADAFNAHDVKAIMSHMTNDCVFEASAGPDLDGEKFTGEEQVEPH